MTAIADKKIGFLLGSLSGAGAEKTILTLANEIAKNNCKVYLFVLKNQCDYTEPKNVSLIFLSKSKKKDQITELREESAKIGILDIFVSSKVDFYGAALAKKQFCSVHITPTAWLKKRAWWSKWKTSVQKIKLKKKFRDKKLIALSEGIKSDLTEHLGCKNSDIYVINNPFNFDEIRTLSERPIKENIKKPYIIYVAAFIKRKRHADLINAFFLSDRKDTNLVLLGKGPERESLEILVKSLDLNDKVIFVNWSSNPYRYIKNARLSVLTSEAEGLPRVLIESIIIGTTVISTNCKSGPNEILVGENKRYLCEVGNIESIKQKINMTLTKKEKQNIEISQFEASRVAKKYLELM